MRPPRPVSRPVVTGDAFVGETLTGKHGTWNPAATGYQEFWIHCYKDPKHKLELHCELHC